METYIHDYSKIRTVKEVFQVSSGATTLKCSALLEVILLLFSLLPSYAKRSSSFISVLREGVKVPPNRQAHGLESDANTCWLPNSRKITPFSGPQMPWM